MSVKHEPHPQNVSGDFYVENGCCTACDVPFYYAPDLFKYDETELHCFVAKQPDNNEEIYQIIKATSFSEVQCIRYAGKNPEILRRLAEAGVSDVCDERQLVRGIRPLLRNHVTFSNSLIQAEYEIASSFREYILSQNATYDRFRATPIKSVQQDATFSFCWYENNYHNVWCNRVELSGDWHVFHSPTDGVASTHSISLMIDEWLKSSGRFTNIKWFTDKSWEKSLNGWQATPI